MGGWAGEVQKKYSRKGKLNEKKNSCKPVNPKKYSYYGLKKIPAARKFPSPPPHNVFNGLSLMIMNMSIRANNSASGLHRVNEEPSYMY